MANTYKKIETVTVGSGGAASIAFTSIPQTYTDLKILLSTRSNAANIPDYYMVSFNGSTSNFTQKGIEGNGATINSGTGTREGADFVGNGSTASIFGNTEFYIPNYTSSNNKAFFCDSVGENNATTAFQNMVGMTWSNTAAITSITLTVGLGTAFVQYSTAILYGIKNT